MGKNMKIVSRGDFNSVVPAGRVASGLPYPSGLLVVDPGAYEYGGEFFDFTSEGPYFLNNVYPGGLDGGQLIVYGGDIPRLMSSFAWMVRYGRYDESKTYDQLTAKARERSLGMRCGHTINWVMDWCGKLGITARIVRPLTGNSAPDPVHPDLIPWADGVDEGHVAIEVLLPTGWALFDVPGNCAFKDATGNYMSLAEVIEAGVDNCEVLDIAPNDSFPTPWSSTEFQTETFFNTRLRFHSDKWRKGVYQIPGIGSGGLTYYYLPTGTESRAAWVAGLSTTYRVMSKADWLEMFYP